MFYLRTENQSKYKQDYFRKSSFTSLTNVFVDEDCK